MEGGRDKKVWKAREKGRITHFEIPRVESREFKRAIKKTKHSNKGYIGARREEKLKVTPYGKILWGIQKERSSGWNSCLCAVINSSEHAPAVSPNVSYPYKEMTFHEMTPLPNIGSEQTLPSFTESFASWSQK